MKFLSKKKWLLTAIALGWAGGGDSLHYNKEVLTIFLFRVQKDRVAEKDDNIQTLNERLAEKV